MKVHFTLNETSVGITADETRYIEIAKASIRKHRKELERFVRWHPFFLVTLEPYDVEDDKEVPEVARRMMKSASLFGVGPMSAVAGTLAELAVEAMRDAGATYAMVDNGGDVALINDREILVGIYAGDSPFSNRIALRIEPSSAIIGICTSSGTVGHSISFGNGDAATVIGDSASVSDAAATALGNHITGKNSIHNAFHSISHVKAVRGALIIYRDILATWGDVPPIVHL